MMKVEFTVDDKWEAGYLMRRKDLDLIYKLADLLQSKDEEGMDIDSIIASINQKHFAEGLGL